MAMGSRRSSPILPAAAAVFSDETMAPKNVPCVQSRASFTSGTTVARLPPNRIALMGTPFRSSHSSAITGHWAADTVKRAFGWAAGSAESGVHGFPFQSVRLAGASSVMPSHQTSPFSVSATFVNMQFSVRLSMAFSFESIPVPGATPKNPASGLMA